MDKKQYVPREYLFPESEQKKIEVEGWSAFADLLEEYGEYRRTGKVGAFLKFVLENGTLEKDDGTRSAGVYAYLVYRVVRPVSIGLVAKPDLKRVQARGGKCYEWFAMARRAFELWQQEQLKEDME